jgi:hypothetical protein
VSAAAAAGVVWSGRSASKSFFTIPIYYFLKSSVTSRSRARVKKKQGSGGYKTGVSLFQAPFKRHQVFSMER